MNMWGIEQGYNFSIKMRKSNTLGGSRCHPDVCEFSSEVFSFFFFSYQIFLVYSFFLIYILMRVNGPEIAYLR